MDLFEDVKRRMHEHRISAGVLNMDWELMELHESVEEGRPDKFIHRDLVERIDDIVAERVFCPYAEPGCDFPGDILLGTTVPSNREVRVSIAHGGVTGSTKVTHIALVGKVRSGKSIASALIGLQATSSSHVVFIDSMNQLSKIPAIREAFDFGGIRDTRSNRLDEISGLPVAEQDQMFLRGLKESYNMQRGEQEAFSFFPEQRERDDLNLPGILEAMLGHEEERTPAPLETKTVQLKGNGLESYKRRRKQLGLNKEGEMRYESGSAFVNRVLTAMEEDTVAEEKRLAAESKSAPTPLHAKSAAG